MTLSAVLLAGGESRRMGRDKATVIFDGEALWKRQLATLQQINAEEIFISARTDPSWRPNDFTFVRDLDDGHGPWSGLAATLAQTSTTHLLALAIDMPLMTARYLKSLRENVQPGRGVVPQIRGRYEPLAAIYPRDADVDLAQTSNALGYSLQRLLEMLVARGVMSVRPVAPEEECVFRNLNEPADLVTP